MSVEDVAGAIKRMEVRGAAEIARSAAEAMRNEAEDFQGHSLEEFRRSLALAKEELLASRPTAISLWNGVQTVLKDTSSAKSADELARLGSEMNVDTGQPVLRGNGTRSPRG